jgi:cytochrome c-type biogenesis protein CcmH/NrfF
MSKRGCGFCVPAKARIYKLQQAGMTDQAIIDVFKQQYGPKIYLSDPSFFYWAVPAGAIVLGLFAIYSFLRRFQHARVARPAEGPADPELARFQAQIDRDTADLN